MCEPVRNEAGVLLRTAEEEMHRWREHFERVLNHDEPPNPPKVEPGDELNIRTGRITRVEIKSAIMKLKNGKAVLIVSLYNIYLVLGPLCKPLLVMELPNKRLLLLLLRQQAATVFHQRQSRLEMRCQRRFF